MELNYSDPDTLKLLLDRLERKIDNLYRHLGVTYEASTLPTYMSDAAELVRRGKDTEAVKIIREYTATGLIEARQMVEQIKRNLGLITADPLETTAFADHTVW